MKNPNCINRFQKSVNLEILIFEFRIIGFLYFDFQKSKKIENFKNSPIFFVSRLESGDISNIVVTLVLLSTYLGKILIFLNL